jgi:hypothetical protein
MVDGFVGLINIAIFVILKHKRWQYFYLMRGIIFPNRG